MWGGTCLACLIQFLLEIILVPFKKRIVYMSKSIDVLCFNSFVRRPVYIENRVRRLAFNFLLT